MCKILARFLLRFLRDSFEISIQQSFTKTCKIFKYNIFCPMQWHIRCFRGNTSYRSSRLWDLTLRQSSGTRFCRGSTDMPDSWTISQVVARIWARILQDLAVFTRFLQDSLRFLQESCQYFWTGFALNIYRPGSGKKINVIHLALNFFLPLPRRYNTWNIDVK
jgi:hypothetical protein